VFVANVTFLYFFQLAVSMASKTASLARELKSLKSDLCFMQERCGLLEEENRRLRDGFAKGVRPEEDDLVRNFINLSHTRLLDM
jgi:cell shape-determining protein MreC